MGINDFSFLNSDGNWHIVTCSSDRTMKLFPVADGALGEATVYNLPEQDEFDYKDNIDKQ